MPLDFGQITHDINEFLPVSADQQPTNDNDESDFLVVDEYATVFAGEAFLVVQNGNALQDVFRLSGDTATTIGRSPDNRIAINDEECSRRHCAVLRQSGQWLVRDLGSSNGTAVNGTKILVDRPLSDGDAIRIGATLLLFTLDLSRTLEPSADHPSDSVETSLETHGVQDASDGTNVVERRAKSPYVSTRGLREALHDTEVRDALARLYRLAIKMVSANHPKQLAEMVLDSLFATLRFDIGGVLLFPADANERTNPDVLRLTCFRSKDEAPYRTISKSLSLDAISKGQAILATNISSQTTAQQDAKYPTLLHIDAQSVICAPIQDDTQLLGLLHLYSLKHENLLDARALEFTLAVAEQMGRSLAKLQRHEELSGELQRTRAENQSLRQLLNFESELIGDSNAMRQLRESIVGAAESDLHVLVRGERGVGKGLVARTIHFHGRRRKAPFVVLDCRARSGNLLQCEQLLESIDRARGGTLHLVEVAEMPPATQAKLALVLAGEQDDVDDAPVDGELDLRIVATTRHDLDAAVERREFASELAERLRDFTISVPPLRERREDVLTLARHFLQSKAANLGRTNLAFASETLDALRAFDWTGNVRELKDTVERVTTIAQGTEIQVEELALGEADSRNSNLDSFVPASLEDIEHEHILRMLRWTGWQLPQAARMLSINRSTLEKKIQRFGIQPPSDVDASE